MRHTRSIRWLRFALLTTLAVAIWVLSAVRGYAWQMLWLPAVIAGGAWPEHGKPARRCCGRRGRRS